MDEDIRKLIISIDKLLKGSSAFTESKKLPPNSADKARDTASMRAGREANKAFKATTTKLGEANGAITGLSKNLVGLNTEVGRTTTSFGTLNSQMAKFMTSLVPLEIPKEVEPNETRGGDCCEKLLKSMEGMWGSVTKLGTDFTADVSKVVQAGQAANTVLGQLLTSQQTHISATDQVRAAIQALVMPQSPPVVTPAPVVNVPAPVVNVTTPVVNVPAPVVNIPAPVVNIPAPVVNIPAPVVNVAAPVVNVPTPVMSVIAPPPPPAPPPVIQALPPTPPPPPTPPIKPNTAPGNPAAPALNSILGRMIDNFSRNTTVMSGLTLAVSNLWKVVEKLTEDFMLLASVGMGSSQNLYEMSKFALMSGMSLEEYQKTVSDNISAAARSGSLEEFNRVITSSSAQLAKLGVYGSTATQMQASLAQANTMMGVSQGSMTDAISAQVSVFDKLRKSTNMTATKFAELITELSKNEKVQKELVGLGPQQRAARQAELLSIATTGQKLGLTAEASEKLANALIDQRAESVKNRFEQAGRIRQLGQLTGMGGEGERAAQIVMKGRAASSAEMEELRGIAGRLDKASQGAYEQGSLGVQSALDYFQDTLGSSAFGEVMKATRPATLAAESGKVNQEAFGQHVGEFGQFVGQLTTLISGFTKSIGPGLLAALGAGLAVIFKGPLAGLLSGALAKIMPGAAGAVGSAVGAGAAAAKGPGILSSIGTAVSKLTAPVGTFLSNIRAMVPTAQSAGAAVGSMASWFANIPKVLRNAYNAVTLTNFISEPLNTVKFLFQELGSKVAGGARAAGSGILQGTKSLVTTMSGMGGSLLNTLRNVLGRFAPIAALIDGVVEAFTGQLAGAMDPSGGILSRVTGVFVAAVMAVPQMILDALTWIFGESFMKPIQSVFDVIKTGFVGAVNGLGLALLSAVSWLTDLLPEESGLRKMVDSAKESLSKSLDENANTINKLGGLMGSENQTTLKEIGEANKKAAEDSEKKSKAATAQATAAATKFNNVQYGTDLSRAGVMADARAVIGEPQVQTPPSVNPDTVNTPEEKAKQQRDAAKQEDQAVAAVGNPEILAALNAILAVMRDNLTQEQRQSELTEQLVTGQRPAATFVPAETIASRLLNHLIT